MTSSPITRLLHPATLNAVALVILLMAIGTIPGSLHAEERLDSASLERYADSHLQKYIGRDINSASVVVVNDKGVLLESSWGLAKPEIKVTATPQQTVYQIGSNSKLFVGVAAMQLYESGKLDLNADIRRYLPDLTIQNRFSQPVTMAELLTHTSGVEDRKLGRTAPFGQPLPSLDEFFRRFPPVVSYPPGEQLNYSGNAMTLAAHVVEAISAERFDEYVERHIYAPLAMSRSSFRQPLPMFLKQDRAAMLDVPPLIKYPEGGMASTVDDMSHLLLALLNGGAYQGERLLQPDTVKAMLSRHFSQNHTMPGIGFVFFEANLNGNTVWLHLENIATSQHSVCRQSIVLDCSLQ